jgi:hypothetical protein
MESKKTWDELVDYCEGINRQDNPKILFEKIEEELSK